MSAVSLAGWGLARRLRIELRGGGRGLLAVALAFAAGFAWRDSAVLHGGDFLAIVAAVSLLVMRGKAGARMHRGDQRIRAMPDSERFQCGVRAAAAALRRHRVAAHSPQRLGASRRRYRARPADRCATAAALCGLFVAADAVFARMVSHAFSINADFLIAHLFGARFWRGGWADCYAPRCCARRSRSLS